MISPRTLRKSGAVVLVTAIALVFMLASRAPAGLPPGTVPPNQFTWTRAIDGGGSSADSFHSVVMDPQGNIIAGGSITDANGNQLFAVTKVDPTGQTILWQRTLTGDQVIQNECRSVAVDPSGNIAATGTVRNTAGGLDLVAMKWDSLGNPLWSAPQIYPGEPGSDDAGDAVKFDSVGNVIVCGYAGTSDTGSDFLVAKFVGSDGTLVWSYALDGGSFTGEEAFAVTTVPGSGAGPNPQDDVVAVGTLSDSGSIYAVRLNGGSVGPSTTEVWTRFLFIDVQTPQNEAYTVAADKNGDIVLGGVFGFRGTPDFFVMKLSGKDGSDAWASTVDIDGGAGGADGVSQLVLDTNGDVLAAGQLTDASGSHFAVAKFLGSDGSLVWQQTVEGTSTPLDNQALSIATDANGSAIAAGYVTNLSTGKTFVAAKWDLNGNQFWVRQASGSVARNDGASAVAVDANGNVAAAGVFIDSGTGADAAIGYVDQQSPVASVAGLNPTALPSAGGTSNLFAKVHDNVSVLTVTARVLNPDNSTTVVTVPQTGGATGPDDYSVALTFPPNNTNTDQVYSVTLDALDTTGNFMPTAEVGSVTVSGDRSAPVLGTGNVTPRSLPQAGGPVSLSVTATDDGMLASVVAKITLPDTTVMSIPLTAGSGNQYTGTYTAPANTGTTDAVYSVSFVATDVATNSRTAPAGGFVVMANDTTPPVISGISLLPSVLPQEGGTIKIGATVTDNVGVQSVTATISTGPASAPSGTGSAQKRFRPTGNTVTLTLQSGNDYAGVFDVAANFTGHDLLHTVTINATDTSANPQSANAGSVRQAGDAQPPAITACDVKPRTLTFSGGQVTITATVTDNVGLSDVSARVSLPAGGTQVLPMSPAGGNDYSVTYSAPANTSSGPQTYGVAIVATDSSGNQQQQDCGSFTVAARDATPPVITNQHLSGTTLGSSGGQVTIFADVTDDVSVGTVTAQVTAPGGNVTTLPMSLAGGSTYQAVFNAPANIGAQDLTYTVQIQATDSSSNFSSASAGAFTVQSKDFAPPSITNCVLSPSTVPQGGGMVTISADVTDNRGVASVIARITRPDNSQANVTLSQVQAGQSTFRGVFSAPPNTTLSTQQYAVVITATDTSNNSASVSCGNITVAGPPVDTTPPVLSACDVAPSSLTYTGGAVLLTVTATDDAQVAGVTARVTGPGGIFSDVNMTLVSGNVYQGTYVAPPNQTASPQTYAVEYRAVDTSGNPAALSCGNITVGVDGDPPAISNRSVAPQSLPGTGGTIVITANVTDPSGVAAVLGVVIFPDGSIHTVPLTLLSGSTYQGSFTLPPNATAEEQIFTVGVSARDTLGNTGSQFIAGVSEEVVSSGKLSVSTDHVDFGKVKFGTRVHGHVTVRNTSQSGQPLIVTIDPLFDPFDVAGVAGATSQRRPANARGVREPFTVTLFPGQSQVLDVSFGPRITQGYADRLQIHSSDPKKSTVQVRVKGIGCRNGRPGTPIGDGGGGS